MERIQVLLHPEERETFRRLAQERGMSLSAWLREAALRRSAEEGAVARLRSREDLRGFFADCDARERGREPEWDEHLTVLDASKREGVAPSPARAERGPDHEGRAVWGGARAAGRGVGRRATPRKRG